jgi:RNA polymerase sigma-70 factor (ECF subfamily)
MSMAISRPEVLEFFRAELGRLTTFVRRRMEEAGAVEAEDVVQDVALRLFTLPDVAQPVENLAAYVFTSLQNRLADLWRSKQRHPEPDCLDGKLAQLAVSAVEGNTPNDPAALVEQCERLQQIDRAMAKLPAEERAVITATEIEGRSFRELADEWTTPIGTLLARKHRAMLKLRTLVIGAQNEEGGKT